MNAEARLAAFYQALSGAGFRCLVMGGHAVRSYGIDRSTLDYDLHLALEPERWVDLPRLLRRLPVISGGPFAEAPSWRPDDFRRFVVGALPDGREERLEFWRRNHLLAPFDELWERREEGCYGGETLAFLALDDLIRSKETEREDDWRDVRLLEEIADERRLAGAQASEGVARALAFLRSRRGFERVVAAGWLSDARQVGAAAQLARHPLPWAFLAPYCPSTPARHEAGPSAAWEIIDGVLRRVAPASARHLALVEAVRRLYRQWAMTTDRADKERQALN